MIPDNVSYKKAIKAYITMMLDRLGWRKGTMQENAYRDSQRDWEWYVKQAKGAALMPNVDQAENIKNQWVRLKPYTNSHSTFFTDLANPERRRIG